MAYLSDRAQHWRPWIWSPRSLSASGRRAFAGQPLHWVWARVRAFFGGAARSRRLFLVDLTLAGSALVISALLRFGVVAPLDLYRPLLSAVPIYCIVCAFVFPLSGLYKRNWRYASILDLMTIIKAVIMSSLVFVLAMFLISRAELLPRSVVAIQLLVLIPLLAGIRLTFRTQDLRTFASTLWWARTDQDQLIPVLLVGAGDGADLYLRALERDRKRAYSPVGVLDSAAAHLGTTLRGVPVLGGLGDLESVLLALDVRGRRPRHLIFTDRISDLGDREQTDYLIACAERAGMAISRLPSPTELRRSRIDDRVELRPIELTDLLERPQTTLDRAALRRLIAGRRVLVTGGGGSIGSELVLQIAALRPAELVVIESSEYNLYTVDLELRERFSGVPHVCCLCNIRDAARVDEIFQRHKPEIVFHAAALKHVPMVEINPCEGVLTNVIGSMNVADAAQKHAALAMVQISTDKVVNPTSVMGATKRLAELYCQALDLTPVQGHEPSRFMTVRFGNVLGSSGSLIPLFQRQLAQGGPLTVTHPEMKRFFMTIREAVELTLQASAYGLEQQLGHGEIFVLDMGEPIRIVDIARRMIRLAGFTPDEDIRVEITGVRPGEKLFEELFDPAERRVSSSVPGVMGAIPTPIALPILQTGFARLRTSATRGDTQGLFEALCDLLPTYRPQRLGAVRSAATPPVAEELALAVAAGGDQPNDSQSLTVH